MRASLASSRARGLAGVVRPECNHGEDESHPEERHPSLCVVVDDDAGCDRSDDHHPVDALVNRARDDAIRAHRPVAHRRVQQNHRTDDRGPHGLVRLPGEEQRADADDVLDDLVQPEPATLCSHVARNTRRASSSGDFDADRANDQRRTATSSYR